MLAFVRRRATKWVAAVILFFVLVAIVVTGFGTGGFGGLGNLGGSGGQRGETLATVGDNVIDANMFKARLDREFGRYQSQYPTLDMPTFVNQGGFDGVLGQMINIRALRQFGEAQGLTVSRQMEDRYIASLPDFRGLGGQFDMNVFRQVLAAQRMSEAEARDDVSRVLMQQQLVAPVSVGMRVPDGVVRIYAAQQLERRRGIVAGIPVAAMAEGINPTEQQITQFYQRHRAGFIVPERRVIKYAMIGQEQVASIAAATDAEIARVYQNSSALYGARETRTVFSITFTGAQARSQAEAFAARVRSGTPFVAAAAQAGFAAGDVTFTDKRREELATATAPEVATAAFGAAQGAIAGPVRSSLGYHVVRVERITNTPARPLAEVRDEIARVIAVRKRDGAFNTLIDRLTEQLSGGASIEDVARGAGLTLVTTPAINAQGAAVGGPAWEAPADLRAVLASAFEMDPDNPEPVIEQVPNQTRFVLLGLDRAIPAAPPPLAEIRDRVRGAYIATEARQRARRLADQLAARINSGVPAARVFAEARPHPQTLQPVEMQRLQVSQAGDRAPPPLRVLFSIPQGHARVIAAPNNRGYFVIAHEQLTPGDAATNPQVTDQIRLQLSSGASEEAAQQFIRAIAHATEIRRQEDAIGRARRQAVAGAVPAGP